MTKISINGTPLMTFSQDQEFNLHIKKDNSCTLEIVKNTIDEGIGFKDLFDGLFVKIMDLKSHLELYLTPHGDFSIVLNKDDLRQRWEDLKEKIKTSSFISEIPEQQVQEMIEKGDLEFSKQYPLEEELKKSVFYSYLFYPIYGRMFHIGKTYRLNEKNTCMSMLFSETEILLDTTMNITEDKQADEYIIKVESHANKMELDRNSLEQKYKEYYPFLKENFDRYDIIINAMFVIDKKSSVLNYADIEIEELTSGHLNAFQRLEIERNTFKEEENE